jgi:hypothetical protein
VRPGVVTVGTLTIGMGLRAGEKAGVMTGESDIVTEAGGLGVLPNRSSEGLRFRINVD